MNLDVVRLEISVAANALAAALRGIPDTAAAPKTNAALDALERAAAALELPAQPGR